MPLDAELLEAHARDNRSALVRLYAQAADLKERAGDEDAACFLLTQAYVFALELSHPDSERLHRRLVAKGREA